MTVYTHATAPGASLAYHIAGLFHAAGDRVRQYRDYRRTLNQLSALSASGLDDLGLTGSDLKQVSRRAACSIR